ncbi:MAG: response regulator [Desulfobacula sp.]|jgi:DNA-binding NtrC family response regulator|nr:response regulator [Desulfobacula sp.]MDA8136913.1 response regulator [Desulfobacteraceae bacterium]OGQ90951.1 MAG: transcriptional regulator [Deltaproteobacteria bacterium RIFOXYC2_FULL_48_10]OGR20310.1 MAG: transcriptional regulator [Desulfobacula sp. RIFOXYA12_FULL_46_16]
MEDPSRLLIVDDNEDILSTFYEFFNSMGYEVKTAVDGFAALKLLRDKSNFFDCLITDLVMPNISGVGLISIVKKEYPHLKIIAMTGYGDQPGALASEAEADVVLFKPIDLFKIENTVAELINQAKDNKKK